MHEHAIHMLAELPIFMLVFEHKTVDYTGQAELSTREEGQFLCFSFKSKYIYLIPNVQFLTLRKA